jgi:superfamily I DNA and/or RNA helicase
MIFNYLRSNDEQNVGFTTDPRRVNVAITRSRRSLIICGSKQTLIGNTIWQDLLRDLIDLSPEIDFLNYNQCRSSMTGSWRQLCLQPCKCKIQKNI